MNNKRAFIQAITRDPFITVNEVDKDTTLLHFHATESGSLSPEQVRQLKLFITLLFNGATHNIDMRVTDNVQTTCNKIIEKINDFQLENSAK